MIHFDASRSSMTTRIRSLAFSSLICVGSIAGAAWAADRLDSEYARSRAESLKHFDRDVHEQDAYYARSWVRYCAKNPARGGCETILRRLKQAKPQAEFLGELQDDPAVRIDGAKR
jgi:hypothetical protein